MKLMRHGPQGQEKPGLVDAQGALRDLSAHVADISPTTLHPDTLARLAAINPATLPLLPEGTRLGACVGQVGNVVAIGLNYADHAAEAGLKPPGQPIVFNKHNGAISGPNDDVLLPPGASPHHHALRPSDVRRLREAEALRNLCERYKTQLIINDDAELAARLNVGVHLGQTDGPLSPTRALLGSKAIIGSKLICDRAFSNTTWSRNH